MLFLENKANLRTDENFIIQENKEHHTERSILENANLGMVTQFLLNYMHLIYLGVVKKIFQIWIRGELKIIKFSGTVIFKIS